MPYNFGVTSELQNQMSTIIAIIHDLGYTRDVHASHLYSTNAMPST